jgi:hypothetical protein
MTEAQLRDEFEPPDEHGEEKNTLDQKGVVNHTIPKGRIGRRKWCSAGMIEADQMAKEPFEEREPSEQKHRNRCHDNGEDPEHIGFPACPLFLATERICRTTSNFL